MIVVLAGASGLIGSMLRERLSNAGHELRQLVRHSPQSAKQLEWHPEHGELNLDALRGADAVIGLSGAGIGDKRWTPDYKRLLESSRVEPTSTLARAIAELRATGAGPATFLSASAVGYYGDTGNVVTTESAPVGAGYLASLCAEWEAATAPAEVAGARVVTLRTGLVLSPNGGLMGRIGPLAKLGLAGPLGSGRQYWPWISLTDEVAAIVFVLEHPDIAGPVNVVGPRPVTSKEFAAATGRVLRRPQPLPVPAIALRIVLGGFADEGVLVGQRAIPEKLAADGFAFQHTDVDSALHYALGR